MQPSLYSLPDIISFSANALTIVVSLLAIIIFLTKRKSLSSAIKLLLNYSFHITLSELTSKLDRVVDLKSDDPEQKRKMICLLNEIIGQIRGNKKLHAGCEDVIRRLAKYAKSPNRINDPDTRSFIAELRETLKHINVKDFDGTLGEEQ